MLFLAFSTLAQNTTDVITELDDPTALVVRGSELFIAHENKVSKIDLMVTNPELVEVVSGLEKPMDILIEGSYLYIAESDANRIVRINIDIDSELEEVITEVETPSALAMYNEELYVGAYNANKIVKVVGLNAQDKVLKDVCLGVESPSDLQVYNDELYVVEFLANKVSKIAIQGFSPNYKTLAKEFKFPISLTSYNDELLVAEFFGNTVSKVNLFNAQKITCNNVFRVAQPNDLLVYGDKLYIAMADRVVKVDLNDVCGKSEKKQKTLSVYPNPAMDYISIDNLEETLEVLIVDTQGKPVMTTKANKSTMIDVHDLKAGMYIMKLANDAVLRFIKK